MQLEIITLGTDVLRRKADEITDINDEILNLINGMKETLAACRGLGLAAPQVDRSLRLFITHAPEDNVRVFINPELVYLSQEQDKYEEGCLSVPDFYADVIRPEKIQIQAWNEKGKPFTIEAGGLLARIIQHENDHLNGKLFIDYLSDVKKQRVMNLLVRKQKN
jgi:peptide deformylase